MAQLDPHMGGSISPTLDNTLAGNTNSERYGFAQREHDMESGLVYMRHRMYDPRIGRFTQMDPILGNRPFEHYRYAGNNPISRTDPTGEDWRIKQSDFASRAAAEVALSDLSKYFGRKAVWGADGVVRFEGTGSGYASSGDIEWLERIQNDPNADGSILYLWNFLANNDDWHRQRFAKAWQSTCDLDTAFGQFWRAGGATLGQAASFGIYQAPADVQALDGFNAVMWTGRAGVTILTLGAGAKIAAVVGGTRVTIAGVTAMGAASSPAGQRAIRALQFSTSQLQRKFKHAADFGVAGNCNPGNMAAYQQAVINQANHAQSVVIPGTYRGQQVTHILNLESGLNSMFDSAMNFISGWKLSGEQLKSVLETGRLF